MKGLSIIMPAYNEADKIVNSIKESLKIFKSFKMPFELLVVNDGSTDDTAKLIKSFKDKYVNLLSYKVNRGKGHAIKYATKFVKYDLVAFVDADLELSPEQLKGFIKLMNKTGADVVIGSKRHPKSQLYYPWHRKFLSDGFYFMNKILFGLPVKDTQTGLKLFRKEVVDKVFPKIVVKGYAFDLEVLVVAHKYKFKIIEAPIKLRFSRFRSRVGFKSIKNIFIDVAGIFYRLHFLRYYD